MTSLFELSNQSLILKKIDKERNLGKKAFKLVSHFPSFFYFLEESLSVTEKFVTLKRPPT